MPGLNMLGHVLKVQGAKQSHSLMSGRVCQEADSLGTEGGSAWGTDQPPPRKGEKPTFEEGGCEECSMVAAGAAREGRGSVGNNVTISQKRPGESQKGAVSFQRNSPPHRFPRSGTPKKRQNRAIIILLSRSPVCLFFFLEEK